jgi:hypothetical protein
MGSQNNYVGFITDSATADGKYVTLNLKGNVPVTAVNARVIL